MFIGNAFRTAACIVLLAGSASASTITDRFSSFWVLGDSLSGPVAGTNQVASDGPLWSQRIAQDFTNAGKAAGIVAIAGATSGVNGTIDLTRQTANLLVNATQFGSKPLVAVWIGGNDIEAISLGRTTFLETVGNYANTFTSLIGAGVRDFLVFEIPDVGSTPRFNGTALQGPATALTQLLNGAFLSNYVIPGDPTNTVLTGVVPGLPGFVNTTQIDTFALSQTALNDPDVFNVPNSDPCFDSDATSATFGPIGDCTQTTFWDTFHPTGLVHEFVADQVRAAYATPIPLPAAGWLMVFAIGSLATMRRRAA